MRFLLVALAVSNALLLAALAVDASKGGGEPVRAWEPADRGDLAALSKAEESAARAAEAKKPGCSRFGPFGKDLIPEAERLAASEWPGKKKVWVGAGSDEAWMLIDAKPKPKDSGTSGSGFGDMVKKCSEEDKSTLWNGGAK